MTQPLVEVAHVGLGAIGREVVRLVLHREDLRLVGVCDIDPALVGQPIGSVLDEDGGDVTVVAVTSEAWRRTRRPRGHPHDVLVARPLPPRAPGRGGGGRPRRVVMRGALLPVGPGPRGRRPGSTPPPARQASPSSAPASTRGSRWTTCPSSSPARRSGSTPCASTGSRTPGCAGSRSRPRSAPASPGRSSTAGWPRGRWARRSHRVRPGRRRGAGLDRRRPGHLRDDRAGVADGRPRRRSARSSRGRSPASTRWPWWSPTASNACGCTCRWPSASGPSQDDIWLTGDPDLHLSVPGGLHGDLATAAALVNTVGSVRHAEPGLRVMSELRPPRPHAS